MQEAGLAVGGRTEGAQVPRRDPVARELRAGDRDVDVGRLVELLAALAARMEQPVLLEVARKLGRDRGPLAQLGEVQLVVRLGQPGRPLAAALLPGSRRRGQFLPDHAQRQELVALEPQDRLEPLDVVLAEEPVAALRPARREQALVLEVADLRDRDVGELGLQRTADRADREQPPLLLSVGCRRGRHFCRNVSLYLPTWSSSPFSSRVAESIRFRFRKVPLRLPSSSM